mmetsp:Transcript_26613/g.76381  ORF Transcript_26613/g.76381 Transcript_26613/m.76381 type:complete len:229 (-) Transcript_26613:367-1053(-)
MSPALSYMSSKSSYSTGMMTISRLACRLIARSVSQTHSADFCHPSVMRGMKTRHVTTPLIVIVRQLSPAQPGQYTSVQNVANPHSLSSCVSCTASGPAVRWLKPTMTWQSSGATTRSGASGATWTAEALPAEGMPMPSPSSRAALSAGGTPAPPLRSSAARSAGETSAPPPRRLPALGGGGLSAPPLRSRAALAAGAEDQQAAGRAQDRGLLAAVAVAVVAAGQRSAA